MQAFKNRFYDELKDRYPKTEIDSFLNLLMERYTGHTRLDLVINPDLKLSEEQWEKLSEALERLKKWEPIQYIIGETEFYGLKFKVGPGVLIPRPETEELVDWILKDLPNKGSGWNMLDIGTGSGCIAVSLSVHSEAQVEAWDVSEEALEIAKTNAKLNNTEVRFEKRDILHPPKIDQQYHLIVSNPPYVRALEKELMQPNVLDYEPHLALFVEDRDALLYYREILKFAHHHLAENGRIYFEINEYLEKDLTELLVDEGYRNFEFGKDIFGKVRMLKVEA